MLTALAGAAWAQQFQVSPDLLAASGGEGDYQTYKVNWSLGEAVIGAGTYSNGDRIVTNGFNQGFYCQWFGIDTIWTLVTNENGESWYENTGTTGPNPHFYESSWCYVSVEELPTIGTGGVSIYPNPTAIELTVELTQWTANTAIAIRDMNGRLLQSQHAQGKRTVIDLSAMAQGMYLLSVTDGGGKPISTHRIIKQ